MSDRSTPTFTVKHDDKEVDIDMDKYAGDYLEEAFGDGWEDIAYEVTDYEDLDENAFEMFKPTGTNLKTLGEAFFKHRQNDAVCAALVDSDGDPDRIDDAMDRLTWVGSSGEDEKDYAAHVVEEGLMGDKLDNYLDHEAIGRDYLADMRTTELKDGRIVAWNE